MLWFTGPNTSTPCASICAFAVRSADRSATSKAKCCTQIGGVHVQRQHLIHVRVVVGANASDSIDTQAHIDVLFILSDRFHGAAIHLQAVQRVMGALWHRRSLQPARRNIVDHDHFPTARIKLEAGQVGDLGGLGIDRAQVVVSRVGAVADAEESVGPHVHGLHR